MATVLPSARRVAIDTFALEMQRRRFIAVVALVLVLEQSLVGLDPFTSWVMTDASAQGDVLRQIIILGVLGLQLLSPATETRPPMAVPASILILLGYCLLTCFWAIEPTIALRRLAFTAAVIWSLVRSIGDLGAVRTLQVVRWTLAVLLVINFVTVFVSPHGMHQADDGDALVGNWRGIMPHKNVAGAACALTVLLFAFDRQRIRAWVAGLVIAGSLVFLAMSQSKTSAAMMVLALAAGAVMRFYNPRYRSALLPAGLTLVALLVGCALMYSGVIEDILQDPGALTGRGAVWPLLVEYAGEHLWTGAGYGSFWQIGYSSPIWTLTTNWVARLAGHGHNGYLDTLVTIGLPGLVLAVLVLFVWPAIRLLCSLSIGRSRRALFCAVMVFCAGHNMTESTLLDRASVVHVFLMIVVILIHRLSDQSAGAHQNLRARLLRLADRNGLQALRGRLPGRAAGLAGQRADRHAARREARRDPRSDSAGSGMEDSIA